MRIRILTENCASGKFGAEHGLSYLVEAGKKILFDTGHTDLFLRNAKLMNISLDTVKTVVLSHGHWDHGNGLKYIEGKKLITHPNAFIKRYRKGGRENIGLNLSYEEISERFDLFTSAKPFKISENIVYLGEIPRENDFEAKTTNFILENKADDFVMDDSAIVVIEKDGLVIISGCSHSGICNIIEYAKKVTMTDMVKAVIGGFHLRDKGHQTMETIKYLKRKNIKSIYPSHCTYLPALAEFYREFGIEHIKSGMVLNFS